MRPILACALLAVLCLLTACGGGLESNLMGKKWTNGDFVVEFLKDGKVVVTSGDRSVSAKYTVMDDQRVLLEIDGVLGQLAGGEQLVYRPVDGVLLRKDVPYLYPDAASWKAAAAANPAAAAAKPTAAAPTALGVVAPISQVEQDDASVRAAMKSYIFAGEVQFQGGCFDDLNQNQVGEYGTLAQLAGRKASGKAAAGKLDLVGPVLRKSDTAYGYTFAVFLPEGVNDRERYFVAYAWPTEAHSTKPVYGLCQDGQLRVSPTPGQRPAASDLFGGADWSTPKWPIHVK